VLLCLFHSFLIGRTCIVSLIHDNSRGGGFPCVKKSDSRLSLISRESSR
jgi:hypothetical protein